MKLTGRTVLVTGAGKRVGREIALALARRGANIVVHCHTAVQEARQLVSEIRDLGVRALAVRADQTNAQQVRAAVVRAGKVDVLIASAAVYRRTPFKTLTEADWDFHLDANLKGPFLWALEVGKRMRTGKMVFFADWAALRPYRHYLPYLVSKAGVICLTKALAKELAPRVQVNAIAPGPVWLPPDFTETETEAVRQATLVKRLGSPQDIVSAVLFLVEGTDFVTGHVLVVDGGRLLGAE